MIQKAIIAIVLVMFASYAAAQSIRGGYFMVIPPTPPPTGCGVGVIDLSSGCVQPMLGGL